MGIFFSKNNKNDSTDTRPPPLDLDPELQVIKDKWEREQMQLKEKLIEQDTEQWQAEIDSDSCSLKFIGGVDISFVKNDSVNACAAFIVLSYPELEVVYEDLQMIELTAPYIAGFLAFREAPFLVDMFENLKKNKPDVLPQVIMVDGNGILHPKQFGLACHLGVLIGVPCLGVAKTLFHVDGIENNQDHKTKIASMEKGGDTFPLVTNAGLTLGVALRSCDSTKNPIYISPGHNISMETSLAIVKKCCKYRIPEPTRQADILSREYLRQNFTGT